MAITAITKPIDKTMPGITLYSANDRTMVISGAKPVMGTTMMALPYRNA